LTSFSFNMLRTSAGVVMSLPPVGGEIDDHRPLAAAMPVVY
jgi:hypothetical protein